MIKKKFDLYKIKKARPYLTKLEFDTNWKEPLKSLKRSVDNNICELQEYKKELDKYEESSVPYINDNYLVVLFDKKGLPLDVMGMFDKKGEADNKIWTLKQTVKCDNLKLIKNKVQELADFVNEWDLKIDTEEIMNNIRSEKAKAMFKCVDFNKLSNYEKQWYFDYWKKNPTKINLY